MIAFLRIYLKTEMKKKKTKICLRCGKRKKLSIDFYPRRCGRYKIPFRAWCKSCESKEAVAWGQTKVGRESQKRSRLKETIKYPGLAARRLRGYRKTNPEQFRDYELRRHYGITLAEWENLLRKQNKQCAICGCHKPNVKNQWFTDHDDGQARITKVRIRGILCGLCNTMLGNARESIQILKAAIKYLKKFKSEKE